MELAKVIGSVWCTRKSDGLTGNKLLLVEPWKGSEEGGGSRVVADLIGAGLGEVVLLTTGSSARRAIGSDQSPVDAAVVAIVDNWELGK